MALQAVGAALAGGGAKHKTVRPIQHSRMVQVQGQSGAQLNRSLETARTDTDWNVRRVSESGIWQAEAQRCRTGEISGARRMRRRNGTRGAARLRGLVIAMGAAEQRSEAVKAKRPSPRRGGLLSRGALHVLVTRVFVDAGHVKT